MKIKRKTQFARTLRTEPTEAEKKLWLKLRRDQLGVRFRRQLPIGNYIVDFACPSRKLIIELDGGQHDDNIDYDNKRTAFLNANGYRVLRFWNNEVFENIDGVVHQIKKELQNP